MLLIEVDKKRYRRHLNIVIGACIAFLVVGSLSISQLLIAFIPSDTGSHFHWNLLGVIVSAIVVLSTLLSYKNHDFLKEVFYVWQLKQALNLITRKMRKLQTAAKMGDVHAMLALQFSYAGSRKLWILDDNIITLDELDKSQSELDVLLVKYNVQLDINQYQRELLKAF
ncbi:DUF3087 domain-containing protein [Psychromonas hadalis]|uniref:DUF3087 domain-containing protein n=1 Tax=Psychromonas hadalis TaxID=211669 RepID=UPI0003B62B81|nr:DUF3087 domain-containing protein [Psychromonas hadalis]